MVKQVRECCADEANRREVEREQHKVGLRVVEECTVCGARHYILEAEPIRVGVTGSDA